MSAYLSSGDLSTYGVATATAAQIVQASGLIDAYLNRPEGLAYSPDRNGLPCYMTALSPQFSLQLGAPISPGQNVTTVLLGIPVTNDLVGEVFIADRPTANLTEALVVSAVNPQAGSVTFASVGVAHASGAPLETGLVLQEERPMPSKRNVTRASKFPMVRLISGLGRYAYGRRSDQVAGLYNDTNLLAALQTFGGPPAWVPFDVTQASVSVTTGEVWIPAGLMLAYYSDVRLKFIAGYPAANIPQPIKQATASICMALMETPELAVGNVKRFAAGGTSIEKFANTVIDADIKAMIDQFAAKLLF